MDLAGEAAAVAAASEVVVVVVEIAVDLAIGTAEIADRAEEASKEVASEVVVVEAAAAVVAKSAKATGSARIVATKTLPGETSAIGASRPNRKELEVVPVAVEVDTEDEVVAGEVLVEVEEVDLGDEGVAESCGEVIETEINARDPTKQTCATVFYITNFIFKLSCSH